ncbi:MAG TPA: two-component regulator propeller domain-containing protein [Verrucomicrobiae bacterium]|nr:two-component regulator propeller domain-containing protein [Verrucomicrobiae bacterium]
MMHAARLLFRRFAFYVSVALLLAGTLPTAAQIVTHTSSDYLIHTWRSEDGLPQNSVNCLAQTPNGYLWVGTRSGGLARFDGMRFVTFNPQSTPELKDVEIETLGVDSTGTLWITAGNESISSLSQGKFHLAREPNGNPRWHPCEMVGEDSDAVYFAAYARAIFRVPREGKLNEAMRVDLSPPPPDPQPGRFSQARDGSLWYVTGNQKIARLQFVPPTNIVSRIFDPGMPAEVLSETTAGEIWVSTGSHIGTITSSGFQERSPRKPMDSWAVQQLIPTKDGGLWVWNGRLLRRMLNDRWVSSVNEFRPNPKSPAPRFFTDSQGGLWAIEYGVGLWHVRSDGTTALLTVNNGLPSKFITCWLEDREGNVWIGTKEAGLARIRKRQFKEFTAADGIPGDVAQTVCEDVQGTIWVGTATGGLARKDGEKFIPMPLTPSPDPLTESVTVCPDANDGIWIGTLQGRIFHCVSDEVRRVNNDVAWGFPLDRLRDHVANAMMQDSEGRVWFCNGSGASYYQDGKLNAFGRARGFVEYVGVRAVAEGPRGTLWFGTEPGDVWKFSDDALTQFHPPKEWSNARVSALLPEADGSVWVGTLGGGLLHFENGKFTRITSREGLPDNSITQLLKDDQGNLWGGTYAGLFRASAVDLKNLAAGKVDEIAFSVHGRFDGLPAQAYSGWFQPSCWKARDGRLWFTTVKGLVVVNPREVSINHRPPPVIIEEMRIDGAAGSFQAITSGETTQTPLRIGPGRHYIEFHFTGIDFTAPDKVRFKWRLEGVEKQWREGINQHVAGYGPLMPGNYRFCVLAANSDGIWNEAQARVAFVVLPYFWETWWFKAFLIVAFFGTLALALHRRHRFEVERLERRHEMERERTRIARDMHDEIGSKLARISFLSELAKEENAPRNGNGTVDSLSRTARDLLQSLDRMLWAVNPRNDSLEKLSAYLNAHAAEYFQNTPIRWRLAFPKNLPPVQLSAEARHNIFLAFEESLANTLKHSGATEVSAELACHDDTVEVSVADNGRGFDVEKEMALAAQRETGGHLGLTGMVQRLHSLGGECRITSSPQGGTTVRFILPLPKNHAS